jgi:hypothetical protein
MNFRFAIIILSCALCVMARRQQNDSAVIGVDSSRIADSLQAAEQKMIAEFAAAEEALKADKARKEQQRLEQEQLVAKLQQEARENPTTAKNAVESRTIVIDPTSTIGITIDSLDREITAVRTKLYRTAKEYKKLETLNADDQVAYLEFMIANKLRDTTEVVGAFEQLYQVHKMESDKLTMLRDTNEGNERSFFQAHLRNAQKQMSRLGALILNLSPQAQSPKIR